MFVLYTRRILFIFVYVYRSSRNNIYLCILWCLQYSERKVDISISKPNSKLSPWNHAFRSKKSGSTSRDRSSPVYLSILQLPLPSSRLEPPSVKIWLCRLRRLRNPAYQWYFWWFSNARLGDRRFNSLLRYRTTYFTHCVQMMTSSANPRKRD